MLRDIRNNQKVVEFVRSHPALMSALRSNARVHEALRGQPFATAVTDANPLEQYFRTNEGRLISKWHHYFSIYDRHLSQYRNKPITMVEFGVFHGGSLQMWKSYFGPQVRIIGVDINPRCAELAEDQVEIVIGDQDDREFLADLARRVGPVDVVIEDGGHRMTQQINTLEAMWPAVVDGGLFIAEDLHTSYWPEYGGDYLASDTFIEYTKRLIDQMNAWHAPAGSALKVDDYTRSLFGMSVYDSVVVLEKAAMERPRTSTTGTPSFPTL